MVEINIQTSRAGIEAVGLEALLLKIRKVLPKNQLGQTGRLI